MPRRRGTTPEATGSTRPERSEHAGNSSGIAKPTACLANDAAALATENAIPPSRWLIGILRPRQLTGSIGEVGVDRQTVWCLVSRDFPC
jgi:hypothetical protein